MRYRATTAGFYDGSRVRPGDVINAPEGIKASWLEPVEVPTASPEKKPKKKAKKKVAASKK